MIYHRPDIPRGDNSVIWMLLALIGVLLLVSLCIGSCFGIASAEVISVDQFRGIATDIPQHALPPGYARKSVGWLFREGNLERETFDQLNTGTVIASGLTWLALYSPDNQILFYDDDLRRYRIDNDSAYAISGTVADSVTTVAADSTVSQGASRWLNLTLAVTDDGHPVRIGGVSYTLKGFDSDSVARLTKGYAGSSADSVAMITGFSFYPNNAGFIETDDTTWMFDGSSIIPYAGEVLGGFAYPVYADSGTIDSLWADNAAAGDSCWIFGADFSDANEGRFILWNDPQTERRNIPIYIKQVDTASGEPRALIHADSSLYVGEDHFGTDSRYIVTPHKDQGYFYTDTNLTFENGDIDSTGVHGNMKYFRLALYDPPDRWKTTRAMDGALFMAYPYPGSGYIGHWYGLKILSYDATNDSTIFMAWGNKAYTLVSWTKVSIGIRRANPVDFGQSGVAEAFPYEIGILHRRRAWYAGNDTGLTIWAWTDQAHYDSIVASEQLEGSAAITGLISDGQSIVAVRENQSVLRGGVAGANLDNSETISGFSEDDFYKTPIQAILSGNFTIGPLGLGMFSGGGIREIPTSCNSIFSDSINWTAGERIVAAIYDDRLWLGLPFGTSTTNNRCLVVDPSVQPVNIGFVGEMKPGSFLVRRDAGIDEQLYIGQSDSSCLYLVGGTADRYEQADWRSAWYDGGDLSRNKLVNNFQIDFTATSGDSIWCDFYTKFSETPVWSDTIVATGGSQTHYATVRRSVQGYAVAYGIRTPDAVTVTGFQWDVVAGGQVVRQ